jgi:hypothetical protein
MKLQLYGMGLALLLMLMGCRGAIESTQTPPIVGPISRSQLPESFRAVYDTVSIQGDVVDLLRKACEGVETKVFLGTWCSDSRREVPRFLKVVDAIGGSLGPVSLVGLDRNKKSPDAPEASYGIERVPTFIFLKGGREIGRVVEAPQTTIEADMLTIVAASMNQ